MTVQPDQRPTATDRLRRPTGGPIPPVTRRQMLSGLAGLAAGGAARRACAADRPDWQLHLFSKLLQWLDYDELAEVAAAAGYAGIELTVRPGGHVEPERVAVDLPRAVAAARRAGLRVEMIVTAITSAADPLTEPLLKTAAAEGVGLYRLGYLRYQQQAPLEPQLAVFQRTLRALAQLNERCGITGCYQNHHGGRIMGAAVWDLRTALADLDPEQLGCQYDIRHAVAEATGSWDLGFRLIAPRIRSLALKNFRWKAARPLAPETVPADEGLVPWQQFAGLVEAAGLAVPASVHCEWPTFSAAEAELDVAAKKRLAIARMGAERAFFQEVFTAAG